MKNRVFKILSSILIISIYFLTLIPVSAANTSPNLMELSASDIQLVKNHVSEMVPLVYGESFTLDGSFSIGNAFSSYHTTKNGTLVESDYISYPLFKDNCIIGVVNVILDDDGVVSQVALGVNYAPELQEILYSKSMHPFALIYADDGLYVKFSGSDVICLKSYFDSVSEPSTYTNLDLSYEIEYATSSPVLSITEFDFTSSRVRYPIIETLDIQRVRNTSTDCCPGGICWAASIAMISNALKDTSYTALEVHDICGCLHKHSNYHTAEIDYIEQLGMNASGPYMYDIFNINNTVTWIDSGEYLLLDLQDYDAEVAHNVVAYGYSINADNRSYFYYMDPNNGGMLCSFPSEEGISVSIPLDGHDYLVHCAISAY